MDKKVIDTGGKMKDSRFLALVAIFASLNVICDSLVGIPQFTEGVWYSWIFIVEPLTGLILGPYAGFLSTFTGVMVGHFVYFRGVQEFLFTLGAPIGAMVAGFLFRGKTKRILVYFSVLLGGYFLTPLAWQLPIWGMWDVYLGYVVLLLFSIYLWKATYTSFSSSRRSIIRISLSAFLGLEADVLFRIFVFIPCQAYKIFWSDIDITFLRLVWVAGAAVTPLQIAISILATSILAPPLMGVVSNLLANHKVSDGE